MTDRSARRRRTRSSCPTCACPGLSGIELHDRIERDCPEVLPRLVFSTGDLVSDEAADFARETSCEIIEKPFEFSKLRATIDRILGR